MRVLFCLLTVLLACGVLPAEGPGQISKVTYPEEVRAEVKLSSVPKEIEGLQWNRWTTKNFTVCSLDDSQAKYLHEHLELIKGWLFVRWGLYDVDFSGECKVICVNRADLYKKLFNLEASRAEVRRAEGGRIKETVLFLLVDESPSKTVPVPLTEVCLAEFAQKYNTKFGNWAYKGMSNLNATIPQIRGRVLEVRPVIDADRPMFFSKGVLETDAEQYVKFTPEQRSLYDRCAACFCLMVRKEFGQDKFLALLKRASEASPEAAVKEVLGFDGYDHLDRTLKRYMVDLTNDLKSGRTPDQYLQIREK